MSEIQTMAFTERTPFWCPTCGGVWWVAPGEEITRPVCQGARDDRHGMTHMRREDPATSPDNTVDLMVSA